MKTLKDLVHLLDVLYEKKISYHLGKIRDSILIELTVANQMWEIEFMEDGTIEIEKFIDIGEKFDEKELDTLISEFAEEEGDEEWRPKRMKDIFGILKALDNAKIFYFLERNKNIDSIIIIAVVPGQKWRIECFSNGSVEVEKFFTTTDILDEKELDSLFELVD